MALTSAVFVMYFFNGAKVLFNHNVRLERTSADFSDNLSASGLYHSLLKAAEVAYS